MRTVVRSLAPCLALATALSVVAGADPTPSPARAELQLELADILFDDQRYNDAAPAYLRAKAGARPDQLKRASSGLLRSLLYVAEFSLAYQEALFLRSLDLQEGEGDADLRTLVADGLWAYGLFEEAEAAYRDVLATSPQNARARHGVARGLAARSRYDDALTEIRAALAVDTQDPLLHHTAGMILRGLRRYTEAADAFDRYVDIAPRVQDTTQSRWAQAEADFLRAFGDRVPLEMPAGDVVHTLPFALVNDKVVVRGRINGSDPVELVIDTGAEQMVLSQQTADAVGVHAVTETISAGVGEVGLRGLDVGRVDSVQIGPFEVRNVPAIIKNPPLSLSGIPSRRVPDSISPLAFGLSMVVDYRNHHLILTKMLPDDPADVELPLRMHRLAVVRGIVNGKHSKSFVVDTGGEVISISLTTASTLAMRPPRHIPLRVFGTSGWDPDAYLLPGVDLSFSGINYDNFSVVVLNLHRPSALIGFHIGGIIGHDFLRNYRVAIDLERSMLKLTRYEREI